MIVDVSEKQRDMIYSLAAKSSAEVHAYQHPITEEIILRITRKGMVIVFAVSSDGRITLIQLPNGEVYELYIKWYWINYKHRIGEHRPITCPLCKSGFMYATGDEHSTHYLCHKCSELARILASFFSSNERRG